MMVLTDCEVQEPRCGTTTAFYQQCVSERTLFGGLKYCLIKSLRRANIEGHPAVTPMSTDERMIKIR